MSSVDAVAATQAVIAAGQAEQQAQAARSAADVAQKAAAAAVAATSAGATSMADMLPNIIYSEETLWWLTKAAMLCSLVGIMAPCPTMWSIYKRQKVGKETVVPYFMVFANAYLWVWYAFFEGLFDILNINAASMVVSGLCLLVFAIYANPHERVATRWLLATGVLVVSVFALVVSIGFADQKALRADLLAYPAVVFNIMISIVPTYQMVIMLQTGLCLRRFGAHFQLLGGAIPGSRAYRNCVISLCRSTEGFPIALTVTGFVSSILWGVWSLLKHSLPYLFPNLIGGVLNGAQLGALAYVTWKAAAKYSAAEKEALMVEDGPILKEHTLSKQASKYGGVSAASGILSLPRQEDATHVLKKWLSLYATPKTTPRLGPSEEPSDFATPRRLEEPESPPTYRRAVKPTVAQSERQSLVTGETGAQ